MLPELLPDTVVAVETYGDDTAAEAALYPQEEAVVARAVAKRRREFAAVRVDERGEGDVGAVPRGLVEGDHQLQRRERGPERRHAVREGALDVVVGVAPVRHEHGGAGVVQ